MLERVQYYQSPFPDFKSEEGLALARHLQGQWEAWRDASSELRNIIWPAVDRAFMCKRSLPRNKGMQWTDKGDIGESDLRDAVITLAESFLLNLMPRDESWVQMIPYKAEDQPVNDRFRDYLLFKCRQDNFRGTYGRHITQTAVRGTSAIRRTWLEVQRAMSQGGPAQALFNNNPGFMVPGVTGDDMMEFLDTANFEDPNAMASPLGQMVDRAFETIYSGPSVTCMDMQDVFLEPNCKSVGNGDVPMCFLTYKTLDELHGAVDENNQPLYSNLEELIEQPLDKIWNDSAHRRETSKMMGLNPGTSHNKAAKYVPVMIFHRQLERFQGEKWVDSYFYVANCTGTGKAQIIRAHINESNKGHRSVYIDTYHDHYAESAYGTSAIEKSLPDWHKKNVFSALTLESGLREVYPTMNVVAGLLADDAKVTNIPGGYNFLSYKPQIGPNFMAPVPSSGRGSVIGIQSMQFLGQKILGQVGAQGSSLSVDPSRNITQNKTATQINTESTGASIGQDNFLEKMSIHSLEPIVQAMADDAAQYAREELTEFVLEADGEFSVEYLTDQILRVPRKAIVTGYHGYQNKLAEIDNCNKAFIALTQGNALEYLGATGPLLLREITFKLLSRFGIKDLDRFKVSDGELILSLPEGQSAVQELSQQVLQQAFQATGLPPEATQTLMQVITQLIQGMAQQPGQQQQGPPQMEAA